MSVLADSQFKEINRLKDELQNSQLQRKESTHTSKDFEIQLSNIQKQYDIEAEKYKEKCQLLEENDHEMGEIMKTKGKNQLKISNIC